MSAPADQGGDGTRPAFGSCCSHLQEAMSGADFEPLINEGEDQILYVSVGLIDLEGEEPAIVDHPLFFCPFCGTRVQTAEEVRARTGETGEGDGDPA